MLDEKDIFGIIEGDHTAALLITGICRIEIKDLFRVLIVLHISDALLLDKSIDIIIGNGDIGIGICPELIQHIILFKAIAYGFHISFIAHSVFLELCLKKLHFGIVDFGRIGNAFIDLILISFEYGLDRFIKLCIDLRNFFVGELVKTELIALVKRNAVNNELVLYLGSDSSTGYTV